MSRILDRHRLGRLMADEMDAFEAANPRSRELYQRAQDSLLDGVPMNWMIKWAGAYPLFVEEAWGARFRDVDGHEYVDFCLGDTGAMAGHGPEATRLAVEAQMRKGITHMLPDRGRDRRRGRAASPVRRPLLAVHPHRHRRQPVRDPARPPHHRPLQGRRPQPLLPRVGGRDVRGDRARRRRGRAPRQHRQAGGARGDDAGRGDQRPRGPRARARTRRRGGLPLRARPHQRRASCSPIPGTTRPSGS